MIRTLNKNVVDVVPKISLTDIAPHYLRGTPGSFDPSIPCAI